MVWLATFLLFSYVFITKRWPIKPILNYHALVIKRVVYLARSKCTALVKLVLHASIVCSLVAFLASQWYHTFQLFSNLHFLGLAFFHSKDVFLNGISTLFSKQASMEFVCLIRLCIYHIPQEYVTSKLTARRWSFDRVSL